MPLSTSDPHTASSARPLSPRWWVTDRRGRLVIAQLPNPALVVWLVAVVMGWSGVLGTDGTDGTDRTETVRLVGQGALVAWALDELVRGASPIRRVLGAVVLAVELVHLFA